MQQRSWLRGLDLNQRPSGYEPDELPGCSTPPSTFVNEDGESKLKKADAIGSQKAATCRRTPQISKLAPAVGFEPTTNRLTADRSTTELRWIAYCSKNRQTHFAHSRARGKFQSRDRPRRAGSSRAVAKTALSRARLLSARLAIPVSRESKKL